MERLSKIQIQELVQKSIRGNKGSQYTLYNHYSDAMFFVCNRLLHDNSDAEEVLQDSFIQAFDKLHQLKEASTFGVWLKKIVINKCLNQLRKKKLNFVEIGSDIPNETEDEQVYTLDYTTINEAINTLPTSCRIIFNLFLVDGLKHREIAELLGISVSTSKSQYLRAKQLLKIKLNERIEDER